MASIRSGMAEVLVLGPRLEPLTVACDECRAFIAESVSGWTPMTYVLGLGMVKAIHRALEHPGEAVG